MSEREGEKWEEDEKGRGGDENKMEVSARRAKFWGTEQEASCRNEMVEGESCG